MSEKNTGSAEGGLKVGVGWEGADIAAIGVPVAAIGAAAIIVAIGGAAALPIAAAAGLEIARKVRVRG